MPGYRSLARNRDFTVLWTGEVVNEIGSRMTLFVYPLLAYALTGSALAAAAAEFAHLVGLCGALLPAGVLADRLDRRTVMLVSRGVGALLYGWLAVTTALGTVGLADLVVVGLLTGVATGVYMPAQLSAVRSVVSTEDLPTALSQNHARQHVAGLVGGPLGGALYGVSRSLPFVAGVVGFLVSLVTVARLRTDLSAAPRTGPRRPLRSEIAEGLRFVSERPVFRTIVLWSALNNLVLNALFFVVVIRLVKDGVAPATIGLVEAAAGIGGILGALVVPLVLDRVRTGRLTIGISWLVAPMLVPYAVWGHPLVAGATLGAVIFLMPLAAAGIGAYRMAITPAALQGRVSSAAQFLTMLGIPVAPLLGGVLLETWGGATATLTLAVLACLTALVLTLSAPVRAIPRPPAWPRLDAPPAPEAVGAERALA